MEAGQERQLYSRVLRTRRTATESKSGSGTEGLVNETLTMLEDGQKRIKFHPSKDYVMLVGKAGTGKACSEFVLPGDRTRILESQLTRKDTT